MKIDDKGIQPISTKKTERVGKSKKTQKQGEIAGAASGSRDVAKLSGEAKLLSRIKTELMEIPDVREDHVAALKQSIENGTYKVDVEKLADLIMQHLDLS